MAREMPCMIGNEGSTNLRVCCFGQAVGPSPPLAMDEFNECGLPSIIKAREDMEVLYNGQVQKCVAAVCSSARCLDARIGAPVDRLATNATSVMLGILIVKQRNHSCTAASSSAPKWMARQKAHIPGHHHPPDLMASQPNLYKLNLCSMNANAHCANTQHECRC